LRALRKKLKLSQEQFASRFHLPRGTVRDWEQDAHRPDKAAQILLRITARASDAVVLRYQKVAFFNFIGRTDNERSKASGVAFAYAGTSLSLDGLQCSSQCPVVMVTGNCADASCDSYSSP
jgi:transcriptional regulator with XRE-family HTH domain